MSNAADKAHLLARIQGREALIGIIGSFIARADGIWPCAARAPLATPGTGS
jgi:hypothetical protein